MSAKGCFYSDQSCRNGSKIYATAVAFREEYDGLCGRSRAGRAVESTIGVTTALQSLTRKEARNIYVNCIVATLGMVSYEAGIAEGPDACVHVATVVRLNSSTF